MEISELILQTMNETGRPLKSGEIAERAGIDKKVVDKALKKLKDEGKIVSPRRCFYEPKHP
ncbi:HTH domain-containing protein [Prolixibacter sp. SD074]|jgi:DNA-binding IscR family transcriptional regulator|uniref:HTH domain-containing protein n=1 Tax=Prolixibacter sp. SD074 TaxID=2652391 RepID=UPI00127653ED|nr:HTH domain-containing protein [Prolixibacter sp. SD074]GET28673.1 MarR family transcriptional regulator [Prolixibacter sp. SD074]